MDEAPRRSPYLPMILAWLVPGGGHLVIRRTWPGLVFALAIIPLFGAGLVLGGFENVSQERHPWLFVLQILAGAPAGIAALLTKTTVLTDPLPHRSVGDLFTCAAGLLNLVAIADVWARCTAGDPETRVAAPEPDGIESLVRTDSDDGRSAPPPTPAASPEARDV
ncbi:MAG: hypothetical protein K8T90_15445 [Planctomycetes bacterium]|nr:hypothetical protein [Planctomycetota bacterium]